MLNEEKLQELNEVYLELKNEQGLITDIYIKNNELTIVTNKENYLDLLTILKRKNVFDFSQLIDLTAVDYLGKIERFEIILHLQSLTNNNRLRVKLPLKEDEKAPSLTSLYVNAGWYEREVFDMYGIIFSGNDDMRRILTDYEFDGHPLRKDFPLSGFKEVYYDQNSGQVKYKEVELTAEFRNFNSQSPWKSMQEAINLTKKEYSKEKKEKNGN